MNKTSLDNTDQVLNNLSLSVITDDYGSITGVKLDYIDFMLLLHEGKAHNYILFKQLMEKLEELKSEKDIE